MKREVIEDAIVFLREKGLAKVVKKLGKIVVEGLIGLEINDNSAALVEVNCETDFVARGSEFRVLVVNLVKQALLFNFCKKEQEQEQVRKLLNSFICIAGKKKTVRQIIDDKVLIIGEKIVLRRVAILDKGNAFGGYLHFGDSIGVILSMNVSDKEKINNKMIKVLIKNISMHIAATAPLALSRDFIKLTQINKERAVFKKQAIVQGKPQKIIEKIVNGRIEKFFKENCLLEQIFIKDSEITIKELIRKVAVNLDTEISINKFIRFKVGEGFDKKSVNFVDEVAKIIKF